MPGTSTAAPVSATAESLFQSLFQILSSDVSASLSVTQVPATPSNSASNSKTCGSKSCGKNSASEDAAPNNPDTAALAGAGNSSVLPLLLSSFCFQPQFPAALGQSVQNAPVTATDRIGDSGGQASQSPEATLAPTQSNNTFDPQATARLNSVLQLPWTAALPMLSGKSVPTQGEISKNALVDASGDVPKQDVLANPPIRTAGADQEAAMTVPALTISIRSSSPAQKNMEAPLVVDGPGPAARDAQLSQQSASVAQLAPISDETATANTSAAPAVGKTDIATHAPAISPSLEAVAFGPNTAGADMPVNKTISRGNVLYAESNPASTDFVFAPVTSVKSAAAAGESNQKSDTDQGTPKPPLAVDVLPTFIASTNSADHNPGPHTSNVPQKTEYVSAPEIENHSAGSPLNEMRLQVDGNANQQVSVRLIQQGDGIRVVLQSNDARLTQALQEQAPELSARLEQHQYQADVSLPNIHTASHFSQPNTARDSRGSDWSNNQTFGDQRNPRDRDRQQSRQEDLEEQDAFAALL
jgi:hypothetical protein